MPKDTAKDEEFESFVALKETPEEIAFEVRAQEGALWTGGRLLIGIWAFAFAALAFAYFYLRSANNEDLWRPNGVTAPTAIGAAIFALTVACALLAIFGERRFRAGEALDWEVAGWTAVLAALLVVSLQIYQLTELPFFPGSSGYASCFIGWAAMNIALVLSGAYWLETLLAREIRLRRAVAQDGGAPRSSLPAARLFRANLNGCTYFWGFIALVATLFWVMFYVL
jgi:heme/copper-type cytochrome/quinol oxidase subunit 3